MFTNFCPKSFLNILNKKGGGVGGGGGGLVRGRLGARVFVEAMKYLRYILMDHEIKFSKFLMGHKIFSYVLFS